ncbi:enoyl-CoA hydratase-related protein [Phenylobacterium sp.]|uniref:enoyl-CoA hydratase/isomerase family protein n=1 Tax=Phenylobacterium sp. TaxID=1871053 RepID=UPI0025E07888|nr:enoyl-CoA hydratase-related protein [Phenylobacterium sp.]MBX3483667.1 enoyl-CoA hydratase/isomerase family protein [Phenylobacterium sp.]MCW5759400.1 enoyl-CoA hydratase/isomerase family protein [Phenylobacterium sp.]
MAYETIKVTEAQAGITVITFARPEVANALSTAMGRELLDVWSRLRSDADLRVVILAGEGRHFQAGADLKERNGMTDEAWAEQHRLFEAMIRAQLACPVPIIAAVQGAAMGGGCEMSLACDFTYAAEGARFGLPEAGLGIMPGLGGTQLLTRAVGARRALEIMTTAAPFPAEKALEWGLVSAVVPADALTETVLAVARQIASRAPLSVRGLKRVVHGGQDLDLKRAMDLELTVYNNLFTTEDRREGVASFNEKRTPAFAGR